jgi:predicted nucleic acid-binding Zn ribbon protein
LSHAGCLSVYRWHFIIACYLAVKACDGCCCCANAAGSALLFCSARLVAIMIANAKVDAMATTSSFVILVLLVIIIYLLKNIFYKVIALRFLKNIYSSDLHI